MRKETDWKGLLFLHFLFFLYSLFSVFSKLGSRTEMFSIPFFLCYGAAFLLLGLYALGWQQVLKKMSLFMAYSGKAVVILWGMFWGALIFQEAVTVRKVIGAVIIMFGIVLYTCSEMDKA